MLSWNILSSDWATESQGHFSHATTSSKQLIHWGEKNHHWTVTTPFDEQWNYLKETCKHLGQLFAFQRLNCVSAMYFPWALSWRTSIMYLVHDTYDITCPVPLTGLTLATYLAIPYTAATHTYASQYTRLWGAGRSCWCPGSSLQFKDVANTM